MLSPVNRHKAYEDFISSHRLSTIENEYLEINKFLEPKSLDTVGQSANRRNEYFEMR